VNNQTITIPTKTAKNNQAVQAVALNPVKIFATITAEIAIVYELSGKVKQISSKKELTVENS
jgi:hypothetical protein